MGFIRRLLKRFRSAITGRFVTAEYAKHNPTTTVGEKVDREA